MAGRLLGNMRLRMIALALAVGVSGPVFAQTAPASAPAPRAPFALQSQPLGSALEQFGRSFGFDVVFPESLVRGVRSGSVAPTTSPHAALEQLLEGTGLIARFTRPDAIILEPERAAVPANMTLDRLEVAAPVRSGPSAYRWYGQRLLDESLSLLRDVPELAARPYDLFVYLWIDEQGVVSESRVYGSAGEKREAGLAAAALKSLSLLPPPADMPQPVGLRIASH